jgi:hypothetical protein
MSQTSFRDAELLSAYLDGQLSQADSARLESNLKTNPELRSVYNDLHQSRALLRKLPARRAPRNFTLTPKMAGIKPPLPRIFPIFRLASALAAILFFFGYAANLSVPALTSMRAAAPPPGYGIGGGGGPSEPSVAMAPAAPPAESAPSAPLAAPTQVPAAEVPAIQATAIQAMPTEASQQDNVAPTPTEESSKAAMAAPSETLVQPNVQQKAAPTALPRLESPTWPVSPAWLFGLLALTVISGGISLLVRAKTERDWRKANTLKPRKITARDIFLFGLALLAIVLLSVSIYWMAVSAF